MTAGHFRLHRDGEDWRFAPDRGTSWVRGQVDLAGAGIAPVILRAARRGRVTLFVAGRIVGRETPVLIVTGLEGSVPDHPYGGR